MTKNEYEESPVMLADGSVNLAHVASIRRYTAVLTGGQELPVSKERYMELKRRLVSQIK